MRKFICLVVALLLCLSASAVAENSVPSKTTGDLTRFDVVAENQPGDPEIYLIPVNEVTVGDAIENYQERIDICQVELEKLAAAETIESYFGEVTDKEGNALVLSEALGTTELNVFEFSPVIAGCFKEDCGKVNATMLFPTVYEQDEQVLVLVGIVTIHEDGTQTVAWQAFEGVGQGAAEGMDEVYGSLKVELTPEIVWSIQNNMALLAIVSK